MADRVLLVGTIGQSVWRSTDDGASWTRGKGDLFIESDVRALLPLGDGRVLAGTGTGVSESRDDGVTWQTLPGFPSDYQVWTLALSKRRSEEGGNPGAGTRLWAGACPAALFYSDDEGQHWHEAPARWLRTCAGGAIRVRMTSFLSEGLECWAGAEIDGVQYSRDGGETWERRNEGLGSLDIHSLARLNPEGPDSGPVLLAATNAGLFLSHDGGLQWESLHVDRSFEWSYCRSIAVDLDGAAVLIGNGNGPPGSAGAIWRGRPSARTWEQETLPCRPNSTIWEIVPGSDATWAYSVLGQVFVRRGTGQWEKLPHEFGEIRALRVL